MQSGINKSVRNMSKKETTKKTQTKKNDSKSSDVIVLQNEQVNTNKSVEPKIENEIPQVGDIAKRHTLTTLNIEELVAMERACSIVCGRYEVKARLSGEDNAKFTEFLKYHGMIVGEMEKSVAEVCK